MAKCVRFNMTLKPFVYWAQTEADIFLKIDVKKIEGEPDVCIEEEEIEFTAKGIGSQVNYQHKSHFSSVFQISWNLFREMVWLKSIISFWNFSYLLTRQDQL